MPRIVADTIDAVRAIARPFQPVMVIVCALVLVAFGTAARRALAADKDPRRAEARARFDRGVLLLDEHDDAGALAELRRAYELVPDPQTLLMIGVVEAARGRVVDAVRTFDRVLATPGALSAAQKAIAQQKRAEEARKVAYLRIATTVPATIEVDGIEAATTPLAAPLAVAAGTRLVAAAAAGHLPARKEVTIAGGVTVDLTFDLAPSELHLAHVFVRTDLPDADVMVDGERVGRTPLPGSLTVAPGDRRIELRRPGYESATKTLTLGDGATADVQLTPALSNVAGVPRGRLALEISEPEAEVTVDGRATGVYRAPFSLPIGKHALQIARGGFVPIERFVDVPAAGGGPVRVTLAPTPETRVAYVGHARSVRAWGWGAAGTGAAIGVSGLVLAVVKHGSVGDAQARADAILVTYARGGSCDPKGGGDHIACDASLAGANHDLDHEKSLRTLGYAALGVGVVAAAVGTYLLVTGDDPKKYDTATSEPVLSFTPTVGVGMNLALQGRF